MDLKYLGSHLQTEPHKGVLLLFVAESPCQCWLCCFPATFLTMSDRSCIGSGLCEFSRVDVFCTVVILGLVDLSVSRRSVFGTGALSAFLVGIVHSRALHHCDEICAWLSSDFSTLVTVRGVQSVHPNIDPWYLLTTCDGE